MDGNQLTRRLGFVAFCLLLAACSDQLVTPPQEALFHHRPGHAGGPGGNGNGNGDGNGDGGNGTGGYDVVMSEPGSMGMTTSCGEAGSLHATLNKQGGTHLHVDGPDNDVDLQTDVAWTRKYPEPSSGTFNGCSGVTEFSNGNTFIFFGKQRGQCTVRFIRHFDYFLDDAADTREHFTLASGNLPFPCWSDSGVSARVSGTFDLQYYLRENGTLVHSYTSLTGGAGRTFEFDLTVTRR